MAARGNRALTARASEEIHERVEAQATRLGISKASYIYEAVMLAVEGDEEAQAEIHIPAAVEQALPRRGQRGGVRMPAGRIFDRR